ncbi:MAG: 8-hydroxy-5-deazaflavin:NADPH oxidoreductase [Acidimicrobiaceae bacterium]|jgi:predicted dinucleotide-binding enzyme|nr:8-hydroxy-5-deazaflavin:NADPH oxidoreductase [Acidimicrobiaceae bacterium]MDQ1370300.1 8-hydroxy-5-deazaflavin:NADPH oxidoreductase [Acidimicrobiaceae bacterium]MDQ1378598.1 8-hydroxy-5-deazaflavin:NADPH oxidoreductase [Acidimicrobiaceae bacterium]MDQ1398869.1 8-hydroxy-5-deazaflavin:NADPH oxidoreductase [Acidimicrobiaceae bacterium]
MKIGIIGSGRIGATLARLLVGVGHEVAVANRHTPETLRALHEELGSALHPSSVEEAARFGEVVVVSIPFHSINELPAPALAGKIVVDSNNYYPQRDGQVPALDRDETTSTELLADHLVGARVVKAFNTMYFVTLAQSGDRAKDESERLSLFVAGDDEEAKRIVAGVIEEIGFAAIDTGTLAVGGRRQQPGSDIYNTELTGAEARRVLGQ